MHRVAPQPTKLNTLNTEVPAVKDIAVAVADRVRKSAMESTPDAQLEEISAELVYLCDVIEGKPARTIHVVEDDVSKLVLRSRLMSIMRTELIRHWSDDLSVNPGSILLMLQNLDRLQGAMEVTPIYDEVRQRIFDSRGLELVVELAHDLRSPLTSILFLSETLLRGNSGAVNELQQRQLGIVYSAALGLIGTASDVIELAKGGEHLDISEAATFSLSEILDGVRDMVMPIAEEKKLALYSSSVLPDRRLGHPVPLSRVLLNLTTNALKFTDTGHVELSVESISEDRVEVSVRDTGRGIDPSVLHTIFQPIRRRSGSRHGFQIAGTGLGLSICRKLVAAMGGELQLETSERGTRFYFQIDLPPS